MREDPWVRDARLARESAMARLGIQSLEEEKEEPNSAAPHPWPMGRAAANGPVRRPLSEYRQKIEADGKYIKHGDHFYALMGREGL